MSVRFHRRHGEIVKLVEDGRTARSVEDGWDNSTLFTERRLQRDEIWTLKVERGVGCVVYI